jgi:hypothetical protein
MEGVVLDVCIDAQRSADIEVRGVLLLPLRPEFPNAVGDTCRRAEQQKGGWLGDRPLVAFSWAAIARIAVTALIGRALDGGGNRQERDGGKGKSRSAHHPRRERCTHQPHQLFHDILAAIRIAPGRE